MDHIDMIEKLREKTGLSYEEARAALERADWNLLDALIALEKEGKCGGAGAAYTTDDAAPEEPQSTTVDAAAPRFRDQLRRFWRWLVCLFHKGNRNYLCMEKDGKLQFELPVTLGIILLLAAFWLVIVLFVVALFCGCSFRFRGPDLGTETMNKVMDKAGEVADSIKNEFQQSGESKQN